MERDKETTYCVFRVFKDDGSVIALFPLLSEGPGMCESYQHVGQHGAASFGIVSESTRACRESDQEAVRDLKAELESIGYNLSCHARLPPLRMRRAAERSTR